MGYEVKLLIGKPSLEREEIERDTEKPYDDGSGYEHKKDATGNYVKTGRREHWFNVMAEIDLSKLGGRDDALNRLISKTQAVAKEHIKERFYYFYGTDGNAKITEDCYGAPLWPVPVHAVLDAMRSSHKPGEYRRTDWAMALLEAMKDDPEKLQVIFYGH